MRVLIVTHYFPPETGAPQARLSALAATWAADGDEVTVLTGMPNHPTGVLPPAYRRAVLRRERPRRLPGDPHLAVRHAERGDGPQDARPPELHGQQRAPRRPAERPGRRRGGLLADLLLHPVGLAARPAEAGPVRGRDPRPVARDLRGARRADQPPGHRAARTPRTRRLRRRGPGGRGQRGVPGRPDPARGAAGEGAHDQERRGRRAVRARRRDRPPARRAARARLGAGPGDCLVLYAGTHGISQALPAIADAAALVAARPGRAPASGSRSSGTARTSSACSAGSRSSGCGNVVLLPGVPSAEMPALLAAADICLVPLRKVPLFATFIPSKMFEYLAAGKAVIGSVTGEAAQILAEAGAVGGAAGGQRLARRRHRRAGRRPAAAGGDRPGRPGRSPSGATTGRRWPGSTARSWTWHWPARAR